MVVTTFSLLLDFSVLAVLAMTMELGAAGGGAEALPNSAKALMTFT